MEYMIILGLVVVTIIIIIYFQVMSAAKISGFWHGDPDFLNQANLSKAFLLLRCCGSQFNGYLIMVDMRDNIVVNQPISGEKSKLFNCLSFTACPSMWPKKMKYSATSTTMLLQGEDQIYGAFWRDSYISQALEKN